MNFLVEGRAAVGGLAVLVLAVLVPAVTAAGCSNPWHLSVASTSQGAVPAPAGGSATIVLVRPSVEDRGQSVNIVDSNTHQVQAQIDGGEWTVITVPAGQVDLYFAPGHRTSRARQPGPDLLTGEVAAGRVYVVRYEPPSRWLEVLEAGSAAWDNVPGWLETLRRVDTNRPLAERYSNERGAALHAAHAAARERYLSLASDSRARRTLHAERQPLPANPAMATVQYRDGRAARGAVLEYLPGLSITIQAAGAAPIEVPAQLVESVEFD